MVDGVIIVVVIVAELEWEGRTALKQTDVRDQRIPTESRGRTALVVWSTGGRVHLVLLVVRTIVLIAGRELVVLILLIVLFHVIELIVGTGLSDGVGDGVADHASVHHFGDDDAGRVTDQRSAFERIVRLFLGLHCTCLLLLLVIHFAADPHFPCFHRPTHRFSLCQCDGSSSSDKRSRQIRDPVKTTVVRVTANTSKAIERKKRPRKIIASRTSKEQRERLSYTTLVSGLEDFTVPGKWEVEPEKTGAEIGVHAKGNESMVT